MYIVVSKWGILPGMRDVVEKKGRQLSDLVRSQPGVQFLHTFLNADGVIVDVIGYDSEEAYRNVIVNPEGKFQKALAESEIEKYAVWVGSERGETVN